MTGIVPLPPFPSIPIIPADTTSEPAEKYLRLSFESKTSTAGTAFMDAKCGIDSDNYIIYGHNMKNGTMFREILQYADKADYDNAIQNDKEKSLYDTGVTAKGKSTFFISRR